MAFDFQEFRSELVGDGARPNLFEVQINLPSFAGGGADTSRKITMLGRTAQLPGDTIGQIPVGYFGREIYAAGNRTFPEWTITVINDEDFSIRNAHEKWMNALNTHSSNIRLPEAYSNVSYKIDAYVYQYSKLGPSYPPIKTYKMIGAWPMDISAIDVDWQQNDTIEEFSITYRIDWWESVPSTS